MTRLVARAWPALACLAAWQAWSSSGVSVIIVPSPASVLGELVTHPCLYAAAAAGTLGRTVTGLAAGSAAGCALAVLAWRSRLLAAFVAPPSLLARSVPIVALVPVFASVLRYDARAVQLTITAVISFFPSFAFFGAGLGRVPVASAMLVRGLGASTVRELRFLRLPAAVPSAVVALRSTAPLCVAGALTAEYLVGREGLGYLIARSQSLFRSPESWAAAAVSVCLSLALYAALSAVQLRLESARGSAPPHQRS